MTLAGSKSDNAVTILALPLRGDPIAPCQRGKEHMAGHSHPQAFLAGYVADNNPVTVRDDFGRTGAPCNSARHIVPLIPYSRRECDTLVKPVNMGAEIIKVNETLGGLA